MAETAAQNKSIGRSKKKKKNRELEPGTRERAESGRLLYLNQVKVTSSNTTDIWDGKNDSTIGNEMVSEWTDSGKWDGRKSVKVGNGNGMGSE